MRPPFGFFAELPLGEGSPCASAGDVCGRVSLPSCSGSDVVDFPCLGRDIKIDCIDERSGRLGRRFFQVCLTIRKKGSGKKGQSTSGSGRTQQTLSSCSFEIEVNLSKKTAKRKSRKSKSRPGGALFFLGIVVKTELRLIAANSDIF